MHVRSTYCPARVMAQFSVHTALSEPSQTVRKRVAWFVWQGWFGSERLGTTRVHTLAFSEPSRVEPSQTE